MKLTPLTNRVVAKKEKPMNKTASGLLLPDSGKAEVAYAVVESVGPDVKTVKKADKIIYKEYATTNVKIDDTEYIVLEEKDVLATLK